MKAEFSAPFDADAELVARARATLDLPRLESVKHLLVLIQGRYCEADDLLHISAVHRWLIEAAEQ